MSDELKMPQMGYDMKEGTIVRWLFETGSHVDKNEVVAEIETDKAVVEFQTYLEGFITQILVKEGETVPVGEVIALVGSKDEIVETESEIVEEEVQTITQEPEPLETEPVETAISSSNEIGISNSTIGIVSVKASPVARKLAREKGYDLSKITGTGPAGRITREDVESYVPSETEGQSIISENEAPTETVESDASINDQSSTLTKMRQQIARVTVKSKTEIPHFYISVDVDMTKAIEMRKQVNKLSLIHI